MTKKTELQDMKNDIKMLKQEQRLIKRIRTKTITDKIRIKLMSVKLVYNKYDSKGTMGYNYKQVHKLLDKLDKGE